MASTVAELVWLLGMLKDIGLEFKQSATVYYDNKAALQIAYYRVFHERTIHIAIDCHFIRKKITKRSYKNRVHQHQRTTV